MSVAQYIYNKIVEATSGIEEGVEKASLALSGRARRTYDTENFPPSLYATGPLLKEEEEVNEKATSTLSFSILKLYGFKVKKDSIDGSILFSEPNKDNYRNWKTTRVTTFTYTVRPPVAILEKVTTTITKTFIVVPNLNYPWNLSKCLDAQREIVSILSGAKKAHIFIPPKDMEVSRKSRKKWIFLTKDSFSLSLLFHAITYDVIHRFSIKDILYDFALMRLSASALVRLSYKIKDIDMDWEEVYPIANTVAPVFAAINTLYCGLLSIFPPEIVIKDRHGKTVRPEYSEALRVIYFLDKPEIPKPSIEDIVVLHRNSYYTPAGPYAIKRIEELKFSPSGTQVSVNAEYVQKESVVKIYPLLRERLEAKNVGSKAIRVPLPTTSWDCIRKGTFSMVNFRILQQGILSKPPCTFDELEKLVSMIHYPKFSFSFSSKTGKYKLDAQIQTTVSG